MTCKLPHLSTRAVHSGRTPCPQSGALMPSICMTSTYVQQSPGEHKGYDYTRAGNPTFSELEALLASLEGGKHCTIFSSGLGALTGVAGMLRGGDRVVAVNSLYGGTFRLFHRILAGYNIRFDLIAEAQLEEALKETCQLILFETPSNPLLEVVDIQRVCSIAKDKGIPTLVDNTFATPILQNPLSLGADMVMHSATKYLGGHSDVVGGAVVTSSDELKERLDFNRMALGVNPSPFDAWLIMRGVRTLALRMDRHCSNAHALANELSGRSGVNRVFYPGLETDTGHVLAASQMRGFGGMLSVEFDLSLKEAKQFVSALDFFTLAESLGGVESLVCHPASMTHASIPSADREKMGLSDGLIRFSVGIEAIEDLLTDFDAIV